jgi:hypothetical protein
VPFFVFGGWAAFISRSKTVQQVVAKVLRIHTTEVENAYAACG